MKNIFTHLIAFFAFTFLCQAQDEGHQRTIHKGKNGTISSVEFSGKEKNTPTRAKQFFEEYLEAKPDDQFIKRPIKPNREGFSHEHYEQYYKGVKVDGAGYNFHYTNGRMYLANGHYVKVRNLNATPTRSRGAALQAFISFKKIEKETIADTVISLLVKEIADVTATDTLISVQLVYRIYLESNHPNNNEVGYVNAHTGKVVLTEPRLMDLAGTFATRYNGSQQADTNPVSGGHRLFDNTRGTSIHTLNLQNNSTIVSDAVELIDNDNNWTSVEHASNNNDMGLDIHWALQKIYDYFNSKHNIKGYDNPMSGTGQPINAFVRYGTNTEQRDNAFWNPTLKVFLFGQGVNDFRPLASLDVVGHEFGHAITTYQIGWGIAGDQIVFHEGLSDIWGAILEHRIRPSAAWRIGEQVTLNKPYLRNIQNPKDVNAMQQIADTYLSPLYNRTDSDYLPYVRSGVFSHWFYILANGKSGTNDIGNSYSVTGIGMDLAEELIVEAVFNNYLNGTTTYPAIRTAMINAATAIFGSGSCQHVAVVDA